VPTLPQTEIEEKEEYDTYHGISGRNCLGPDYLIRPDPSGTDVEHNTRVFYDEATEVHLGEMTPLFFTQLSGVVRLPEAAWWMARRPYNMGLDCAGRVFISRLSTSNTRCHLLPHAWRHDIINNFHGQEASAARMQACCSANQVKEVRDGNTKEVLSQLLVQSAVTVAEHSLYLVTTGPTGYQGVSSSGDHALADSWRAHLLIICADFGSRAALNVAVSMVRHSEPLMLDQDPGPDGRPHVHPLEAAALACQDQGVPEMPPDAPLARVALAEVTAREQGQYDETSIRGYNSVSIIPGEIPVPFCRSVRARYERITGAAIPGGSWNPSFVDLTAEAIVARNPVERNLAVLGSPARVRGQHCTADLAMLGQHWAAADLALLGQHCTAAARPK
jgi:hypothetical protein